MGSSVKILTEPWASGSGWTARADGLIAILLSSRGRFDSSRRLYFSDLLGIGGLPPAFLYAAMTAALHASIADALMSIFWPVK
jgi:hypothetical protein